MSDDTTHKFLFTWEIKNFNSIPDRMKAKPIESFPFRIKDSVGSKWTMFLFRGVQGTHVFQNVSCSLNLRESLDIVEKIYVRFQFYLSRPNNVIFRKSPLYTEAFQNPSMTCSEHVLISVDDLKQEMLNWPDDTFTLCCQMENVQVNDLWTLKPSELSVTGCKLETNVCGDESSSIWPLQLSELKTLPIDKEIKLGKISVKVVLKYKNDGIHVYLFSDVKDNRYHVLFYSIYLIDKNSERSEIINNYYCFSSQKNAYKICVISDTDLEKVHCGVGNQIKIKFDLLYYLSHSSVKYCNKEEKYLKYNETQSGSLECRKIAEAECVSCLQHDLRNLLVDKKFTDIKLRIDEEILTAHKILLASRSPVFATMFDQEMTENASGIVDIVDIDAKTFVSFLEYIYTGAVEEMDDEMALNLLVVADKYQVPSLVKMCSSFLKSALSNKNSCNVLLIADMVNQKDLKTFVEEFMLKNMTDILSSPEWSDLVKGNNILATELLFLMSKQLEVNSKISKENKEIPPQSVISFSTLSQDTMNQNFQPQFNTKPLSSSNFNFGAASSTAPFQFAASSDISQATSAGPREIRKPLRRMK